MKNYLWVITLLLICSCKNEKILEGPFADVEIQNLELFMNDNTSDLVVLDVRTPEEINDGKIISEATEIDFFSDSFDRLLGELDKDKTYLVYCKSGGRSGKTVKKMQKMGFKQAHNLLGGYSSWSKKK